jgi:hypothetical protein
MNAAPEKPPLLLLTGPDCGARSTNGSGRRPAKAEATEYPSQVSAQFLAQRLSQRQTNSELYFENWNAAISSYSQADRNQIGGIRSATERKSTGCRHAAHCKFSQPICRLSSPLLTAGSGRNWRCHFGPGCIA